MVLWYFVGNFNTSTEQMAQIGFGKFSANLNAFFNGLGEQFLMPTLGFKEGQYEGQGYLGIGLLGMALMAFIFYLARAKKDDMPKISFSPLGFVTVLFALFALSHV